MNRNDQSRYLSGFLQETKKVSFTKFLRFAERELLLFTQFVAVPQWHTANAYKWSLTQLTKCAHKFISLSLNRNCVPFSCFPLFIIMICRSSFLFISVCLSRFSPFYTWNRRVSSMFWARNQKTNSVTGVRWMIILSFSQKLTKS